MKNKKELPTLRGWPRRIVEAGGVAAVGASTFRLHKDAILPRGVDDQLVAGLKADGWLVTVTPTERCSDEDA